MRIGIDLGTTFCCVAYIDELGEPHIVPNSEGGKTTPSVIWFNGKTAFVGDKANKKKLESGRNSSSIIEFVKRNIGAPVEASFDSDEIPIPYDHIDGFKYGAEGMSAIILRKLKLDAIDYFKKKGLIDSAQPERDIQIEAVITAPAYFNDLQRKKTKLAGYSAGLNVKAIINEPTAAALSYPFPMGAGKKTIMVFDLGGGTFDVTILEFNGKEYNVITSDGVHQLGGKDWDELIIEHLHHAYQCSTGKEISEEMVFDVQKKSLDAKFSLSRHSEVTVSVCVENNYVETKLERTEPIRDNLMVDFENSVPPFYFETRASNLLAACRSLCLQTLQKAKLEWFQIDEIVLAGGSCRMPMIPKMLKEISGKDVRTVIPGFDYDTAIAAGAARYGKIGGYQIVNDVVSHSIGVKCFINNCPRIDPLIRKDAILPAVGESMYTASGQGSLIEVYEGESDLLDECIKRGTLRLPPVDGKVTLIMNLDENNILKVIADYPPHRQEMVFDSDDKDAKRAIELKEKVHAIDIRN